MINGTALIAVDKKKRCEWEVLGIHESVEKALAHAKRIIRDKKRQLWISNPNGMRCPACGGKGCDDCNGMGYLTKWRVKHDTWIGRADEAPANRQDQDRGEG